MPNLKLMNYLRKMKLKRNNFKNLICIIKILNLSIQN